MAITDSRYKTLCLIVFFPLLLLGFVSAHILNPYQPYLDILCEQTLSSTENCRDASPLFSPFYNTVKKDYGSWFELLTDSTAPVIPGVEASERTMVGAEIVSAAPLPLSRDASDYNIVALMKSFVGLSSVIYLGGTGMLPSTYGGNAVLMNCSSLSSESEPDVYNSLCYGNGWGGSISYRVSGQAKAMLDQLNTSVRQIINDKNSNHLIYMIVMYPLFVYAFFIISLLWWLTVKSVRFVMNGRAVQR